jgi:ATP-dependent helicase/DNAse subunit B
MFSGDVALWTQTRRSVQILEGLAAAHRTFDHVFVVGLAGGGFPLRPPVSPFHDESERSALSAAGLPFETRAQWERRERELFRAIVATAEQSLTLSWARLDARGADTVPSAFLEEIAEITNATARVIPTRDVITRGIPVVPGQEAVRSATHAATIERLRATGTPSPYNGLIQAPDLKQQLAARLGETRVWSATQLESFAKCPWAFFSARLLYLEKLEDPDIDIDPRVRGTLLHDALHRFFDKARERTQAPVFLLPDDLAIWGVRLARESLDEAIDAADEEIWLGQPALRETKRAELHRMMEKYLDQEAERNRDLLTSRHRTRTRVLRTAVDAHEQVFQDVPLVIDGERILVRGMIDRIEVSIDDRVPATEWLAAVDYKTSKWSAPGGGDKAAWTDGVVLQVPLYAKVLTQLRPGSRVARVEYRAIRGAERVHTLELVQVSKQGSRHVLEPQPEEQDRMQAALDAVAEHVRRARNGEFPAQPAPSCMCPRFCHAWEICRVKGGPRAKW